VFPACFWKVTAFFVAGRIAEDDHRDYLRISKNPGDKDHLAVPTGRPNLLISQHDMLNRANTESWRWRHMANVRDPANCAACGRTLPAQEGRGRQRHYCGATCRSAARRGRSRALASAGARRVNVNLTAELRKANLDNTADGAVLGEMVAVAEHFCHDWIESGPLTAVSSAKHLAAAVDDALRATVQRARAAGHTWQEIGDLLGTSRQAAFQRFGRPADPDADLLGPAPELP
jgi:hypothetical protein